jgi:hypothetical protein
MSKRQKRSAGNKRKREYVKKEKKEMNYFDNNALTDISSTTGSITKDSLCLVPLSEGPQTRGKKGIRIKKIQARWILQLDSAAAATETADVARVIIYLDTMCNGAAATPAQILASTDVLSYRNELEGGRFKFLVDRFYSLNTLAAINNTGWDGGIVNVFDSCYLSKDIVIQYSNDSGTPTPTIAHVKKNNIGVLFITEDSSLNVALEMYTRIRYEDL